VSSLGGELRSHPKWRRLGLAPPVAAGPVAAGPVAAGPVAAGPVAAGPVAAGPVHHLPSLSVRGVFCSPRPGPLPCPGPANQRTSALVQPLLVQPRRAARPHLAPLGAVPLPLRRPRHARLLLAVRAPAAAAAGGRGRRPAGRSAPPPRPCRLLAALPLCRAAALPLCGALRPASRRPCPHLKRCASDSPSAPSSRAPARCSPSQAAALGTAASSPSSRRAGSAQPGGSPRLSAACGAGFRATSGQCDATKRYAAAGASGHTRHSSALSRPGSSSPMLPSA
jgi:hypothetical protein